MGRSKRGPTKGTIFFFFYVLIQKNKLTNVQIFKMFENKKILIYLGSIPRNSSGWGSIQIFKISKM
jgi:hypothetical protein